jgi:anti-anti-sigma factor
MTTLVPEHMQLCISRPGAGSVDYVRIAGDVDLRSARALGLAARRLMEADADLIYVDLGGVTFMGSVLVGFLRQIGNGTVAVRRPVVLCRPGPMPRRTIYFTGLDRLATVRPDLPPEWPADPAGEVTREGS